MCFSLDLLQIGANLLFGAKLQNKVKEKNAASPR